VVQTCASDVHNESCSGALVLVDGHQIPVRVVIVSVNLDRQYLLTTGAKTMSVTDFNFKYACHAWSSTLAYLPTTSGDNRNNFHFYAAGSTIMDDTFFGINAFGLCLSRIFRLANSKCLFNNSRETCLFCTALWIIFCKILGITPSIKLCIMSGTTTCVTSI